MDDLYPFRGLRVVDTSQGIAGPSAAMTLARYGADVIKVEPTTGDWSRHKGFNADRIAAQTVGNNLCKRSIALDLKNPDAAAVLRQLLAKADVFVQSLRPGVMDRLGFGYDDVCKLKKDIVYLSISGYGQQGPWREKGAVDVVMQAFSGLMSVNLGSVDGLPHRIGLRLVDSVGGMYASQALMAALYARRDTGRGQHIDCSLLRATTALQSLAILEHSAGARSEQRVNSCPLGTYRSKDGWINLGVTKDSLWPVFCDVIQRPKLGADPALAKAAQRVLRIDEINKIVEDVIVTETSDCWIRRFEAAGIMIERVNGYSDLLAHPQVEASGAVTWIEQPDMGRVAVANPPGMAPLVSGAPLAAAPGLGQHSREILRELGYQDKDVEALIKSGAAAAA